MTNYKVDAIITIKIALMKEIHANYQSREHYFFGTTTIYTES